ncbi:hypothetical protein Q3G72_024480 [Acer saccharum]|nr:hypothetical protein Q3G72_024480 [Acer saccharum]
MIFLTICFGPTQAQQQPFPSSTIPAAPIFHLVKSLLSARSRAHSHGHYHPQPTVATRHLRQWPAPRFLATFRRLPKFSSSRGCLPNINAHSPTNLHCRRRNQGL